jgi:hypothetical protein
LSEAPDLEGFGEAQKQLRDAFGEPIVFINPPTRVWPPGTKLDDETGEPYDPTIEPALTQTDNRLAKGDVATRPFSAEDVEWAPAGMVEREHVMVAMDLPYASAASAATSFMVRGAEYKVSSSRPDGVGALQRFLTFGRRK